MDKRKKKEAKVPLNLSTAALVLKCKILFQRIQGYPFEFFVDNFEVGLLVRCFKIKKNLCIPKNGILNSLPYMRLGEDKGDYMEFDFTFLHIQFFSIIQKDPKGRGHGICS